MITIGHPVQWNLYNKDIFAVLHMNVCYCRGLRFEFGFEHTYANDFKWNSTVGSIQQVAAFRK